MFFLVFFRYPYLYLSTQCEYFCHHCFCVWMGSPLWLLQEEAAEHHAEPSYGTELEDSHHLHRTRTYPWLMQSLWLKNFNLRCIFFVTVNLCCKLFYFGVSSVWRIELCMQCCPSLNTRCSSWSRHCHRSSISHHKVRVHTMFCLATNFPMVLPTFLLFF